MMTATGKGSRRVTLVVADASGSMREHGKTMLARNLIAYVRESWEFGGRRNQLGELCVVVWGSEASILAVKPGQELPAYAVGGRASVRPLVTLFDSFPEEDCLRHVLIISDGHLASSDVAEFKGWRRAAPKVSVRALPVGPDAVPTTLAKLADPGGVFPPAEVVLAVASWRPLSPGLPATPADVAAVLACG